MARPWSCGGVHGEARAVRALGHDGALTVGAVGDLHGDVARATAAATQLAAAGVDAIVALGDDGGKGDESARVWTALATAKRPLLVLAGEAEDEGAFHAAVKTVRAAGVDVVDLVDTRVLEAGAVEIVSAPGYRYWKEGCRYTADDLQELRAFVGAAKRPTLLVAHAVARDEGDGGIDRGYGDADVGDAALRAFVGGLRPAAALFGHLDEAGGRTRGAWVEVGAKTVVVRVDGDGRASVRVLP